MGLHQTKKPLYCKRNNKLKRQPTEQEKIFVNHMYVSRYIYVYLYEYMYIYIHTYIYLYIYIIYHTHRHLYHISQQPKKASNAIKSGQRIDIFSKEGNSSMKYSAIAI